MLRQRHLAALPSSKSTASEILASGRCRRLHNSDEPETRRGQPEFTAADAEAVASYICQAPLRRRVIHDRTLQKELVL
jgi:hypothetical protein